ncbi:MAG: GDSL-type esterase/lipase family protein [Armatimonadota bacterium]
MLLEYNHPSVRLTGRWYCDSEKRASTVCTGSSIDIAFKGGYALLFFDTSTNIDPFPHLWLELDGNGRVEAPLDRILRVEAEGQGQHHLKVIFKSAVELQNRWKEPIQAVIRFKGVEVEDAAELSSEEKPVIEFVGDSITEGILIDVEHCPAANYNQRIYQDDACATYAWLAAEKLSMQPVMMGFGRIGVTIDANGGVPVIQESYPLCYEGAPLTDSKPKAIVINIGTNDMSAPLDDFKNGYIALLKAIRSKNPDAGIFALSPFIGYFEESLPGIVAEYNDTCHDDVKVISTAGWLPKEPMHPRRDGHKRAGKLLAEQLAKSI